MSNFRGTKGKWKLEKNSVNAYSLLSSEGWKGDYIALINSPWVVKSQKVADANALLISKAPEMLDMLEQIYEEWCETGIGQNKLDSYMSQIKQLIKEATQL